MLFTEQTVCVTVNQTNTQPEFQPSPPPSAVVDEGQVLSVPLSATDLDSDQTLSFSLVSAPPFASVSTDPMTPGAGATGTLTLAPSFSDAGSSCFQIRVADSGGGETLASFCAIVNDVNRPPALGPVPPLSVGQAMALDQPVHASDPDGDLMTLTLEGPVPSYVTLLPDPPASGSATGILRIQPGPNAGPGGCFGLRVVENRPEGALSMTQTVCVTVFATNTLPVFEPLPPPSVAVNEGQVVTVPLSAYDPDLEQTITFELRLPPPFASVTRDTSVPGGVSTGTLTLAPGFNETSAPQCFGIRVLDTDGGEAEVPFCVTVSDVNRPPVVTAPAAVPEPSRGSLSRSP